MLGKSSMQAIFFAIAKNGNFGCFTGVGGELLVYSKSRLISWPCKSMQEGQQ